MPDIQAYRVYVSGVPSTFGDIDSAMAFVRAESIHNNIPNLAFESTTMDLTAYQREVTEQEDRK